MAESVDQGSAETLTFLFTDLEGSTRLWERYPDAMKGALKRHDGILRSAVEISRGRVVKSTGDGTMAIFGSAVDAVGASLAAQRELTATPWPETGPLRVRMGLHSGQAEKRADDFFGPTVNRAARIMAAGHGGQVLLSSSAASLAVERLPSGASLLDLGEHRLKDIGRAEHVFQLIHADLTSSFPPLAAAGPVATNVPARAAAFVGRQTALAEIRDRLRDSSMRMLTLVGPGGTGKTTLAIRATEDVSSEFADGVFFIDLSSARDTDAVLIAVGRALGVSEAVDHPILEELVNRLRDRRVLLVLDNFEQVTVAANVVAKLLGDCPKLTVLVTSREALHIRAEHVLPVPPLELPPTGAKQTSASQLENFEAIQLFVERARAVRADFQLSDANAQTVAEVCRRLDGLPLAIELATARLRLFSPEALLEQLKNRLGVLRSGPRDLPERQRALRSTMDWSYDLLKPEEQRLFEFLGMFADADITAAETVAARLDAADGISLDVLDGLSSLIEKSLIRRIDLPSGDTRVAMLETMREFASDRLAQRPELDQRARQAHATYFADFAREQLAALTGRGRPEALEAMTADVGNLRIAWQYWLKAADLAELEKMTDSLLVLNDARGWYLDTVALTTDILAILETAADRPERLTREIALRGSLARALMATRGFTPEVEEAFTHAVELFERSADARQQFSLLRALASLYQLRGQVEKAEPLGRDLLALAERTDDPKMLIDGHLVMGSFLVFVNDLEGGLRHLDKAISLFAGGPAYAFAARANDPRVTCYTTSAFTLWMMGFPDRATDRMQGALDLAAELQHPFTSAFARFHAGLLHFWRREPELVVERVTSLLEIAGEHDFKVWIAAGECLRGAAQCRLGRVDEGLGNIHSGMELYQGLRFPPVFWPMLLQLQAAANLAARRPADGLGPIEGAIGMMSQGAGTTILPELLNLKGDLIGAAAGEAGDMSEAERWYQSAYDRAAMLNARMAQMRAATRLCRLWQARGDADPARNLTPIFATFTEGFATVDWQEARDLLGEVSRGAAGSKS